VINLTGNGFCGGEGPIYNGFPNVAGVTGLSNNGFVLQLGIAPSGQQDDEADIGDSD
jgi:hypothetical protein